jgi:O-antigen/teichoic acid export membrane protein
MRMASQASLPVSPGFWGGVALNFGSRVATVLLGLAILVVVARLGPEALGAFSLFVAIEAGIVALGSGLGLLLAREAAQTGGPLQSQRLLRLLGVACIAGLVAAMALMIVSYLSPDRPYELLWILAIAAPFLLLAPTVVGLWMGQGRLVALNAVQVASPLLVLAMLALLPLLGHEGLVATLLAWVLARTVVGLGAAGWALRRPSLVAAREPPVATAAAGAWKFVLMIALANVISLANYRAMLFVVERTQGLAVAGIYSIAAQVAEMLWLLSWAVTVSVYARIGARDSTAAVATTLRAVRLGVMAAMLAAPLLGIAAWLAVPLLLGEAYRPALVPLAWLLPGVVVYASASALSAYYTQHRAHPHWPAGIAALSLVLALGIGSWAVPRWGAAGAAVATSTAYVLAILVALSLFARDARLSWSSLWRHDVAHAGRPF